MKEVDMYKLFSHENIIKVIDTCVIQDRDGGKIVYIFLPYFKNGNLQDAINRNLSQDRCFSEKEMLKIFRSLCYAVRALHTYKFPSVPLRSDNTTTNSSVNGMVNGMNNNLNTSQSEDGEDNIVPFAHRDIKPGNVLLSDDQTPVLMDFGSLIRARIKIQTRNQALLQKELAEEHSTMPYRAPELFDVQTGAQLDEKVDIWSLGCTLYAMAYGNSPFETSISEQGGSIALAVLNAQVRFPSVEQDKYSQELRDLVSFMLKVDPKARPDIHQVIAKVDAQLEQLGS